MTSVQVKEALAGIKDRLDEDLDLAGKVTLRDSASWYREAFPAAGTWEGWIWETVNGKNFKTRQPHFAGFVVCGGVLGRANAQVVELALRDKRAVLQWTSTRHPLRVVAAVTKRNTDSWIDGWGVATNPLGEE